MIWHGVFPAITTPFDEALNVDHAFLAKHARWQLDAGCKGLVALGSLGEGATLSHEEKLEVLKTCIDVTDRPVIAGISALSTDEAVTLAKEAEKAGCQGLMVLPQYVYKGDWRENKAHVASVIRATSLPCMLYNNPVAYGIDFLPEQIAELATEHPNLEAVKESSTDVRRVTAIRALLGNRLALFVGVDDAIVEGIAAGAVGWVAGLVNAFPAESVKLFDLAVAGEDQAAFELYRWFLPLLRLDTLPKFVQYIKLTQQVVGMGHERTRPPRLTIAGDERKHVMAVIERAVGTRKKL
ncbi:MAG TPA: dihydrodipicolinate synthase family protein [Fimbriimonadaceae bacterium]|nr:dihydrodipicolinate synthase family protein [Fimbriimonadaceae bacterium]